MASCACDSLTNVRMAPRRQRWWWCNPDKTYPVANWKLINNVWYYFNQSGYMTENQWVMNNNRWYYCGVSGALVKSQWVQTNGAWYYCGADGAMLTSQMIGGQYYVDKMASGCSRIKFQKPFKTKVFRIIIKTDNFAP